MQYSILFQLFLVPLAVANATGAAAAASALLLFTLFLLKLLTRKTDTILYPTLHTQFMFLNPVVSRHPPREPTSGSVPAAEET